MTQIIQATSSKDLLAKLACLAITVAPRSRGRTKRQTEQFSMAHLLATLPQDCLAFPLTLDHGDRPDFVVTFDDRTIVTCPLLPYQ